MGAGGNSSVGGRYTRFHWGTQQGGIQVDALSTSFEIQTQGIDCHFLSFALITSRTLFFIDLITVMLSTCL